MATKVSEAAARMCQTKPGSNVKVFTLFFVMLCTSSLS